MGVLYNPAHERFCQTLHRLTLEGRKRGAARTAAYREAIYQGGDATDAQLAPNARRFANGKDVKARLAEIAEYEAKLAGLDRVWLVAKVKEAIESDGKDRVPAMKLMVDIQGWGAPSRHEHSGPGGAPIEVAEYTDAQRAQALAVFIAKLKRAPDIPA